MVKRFVKYRFAQGKFNGGVDYVYYNSKKFIAVLKDGTQRNCRCTNTECFNAINRGWWIENGELVDRKRKKVTKSQKFHKNKMYLFVEPDYIWFCKGEYVIKHKWYRGYELKTKNELDEECFVGQGKFIVELP